MSYFKNNPKALIVVESILGSTEGTRYRMTPTNVNPQGLLIDKRTEAIQSTGNSGLSFGATQLDVANNPEAKEIFEGLLHRAVNEGRISSIQSIDWLNRADTVGLSASSSAFSNSELQEIKEKVLNFGILDIQNGDKNEFQKVLNSLDSVANAIQQKWGDLGVLDPNHPDYLKAIGHMISWSNRTNGLSSMGDFLAGRGPHQELDQLTGAPTLEDIENYLQTQIQFEDNPGEFENVGFH